MALAVSNIILGFETAPKPKGDIGVGRHLWRQNLEHFSNYALKHDLQTRETSFTPTTNLVGTASAVNLDVRR